MLSPEGYTDYYVSFLDWRNNKDADLLYDNGCVAVQIVRVIGNANYKFKDLNIIKMAIKEHKLMHPNWKSYWYKIKHFCVSVCLSVPD